MNKFVKFKSKVWSFVSNIVFYTKYSIRVVGWSVIWLIASTITETLFSAILLLFPQFIVDKLVQQAGWNVVLLYIFTYVGLLVSHSAISSLFDIIKMRISRKINKKHIMLFNRMRITIDYSMQEDSEIADKETILRLELMPYIFLTINIFGTLECAIKCVIYSAVIGSVHPLILLFMFLITVSHLIINKKKEKNEFVFQNQTVNLSRKIKYFFDIALDFSHAKEIRLNNASEYFKTKLQSLKNTFYVQTLNKNKKELWLEAALIIIAAVETIGVYIYALIKVLSQNITIGGFTVFIVAIQNFVSSINALVDRFIQMKRISERIRDFKDYTSHVGSSILNPAAHTKNGNHTALEKKKTFSSIEFKNVCFCYPGHERMVLKNISFVIHAGEKISLVGLNGAGKTTLIKLLCGLYKPTSGVIEIDGKDMDSLKKQKIYPSCSR